MTTENCLFIGGCADGERQPVDDRRHYVRIERPRRRRADVERAVTNNAVNFSELVESQDYEAFVFNMNGERFRVFAPEQWDYRDVFAELIRRYPVESKP